MQADLHHTDSLLCRSSLLFESPHRIDPRNHHPSHQAIFFELQTDPRWVLFVIDLLPTPLRTTPSAVRKPPSSNLKVLSI
ncbi:hypothetical protein QJS10_CPA03g01911 [Acorus calamus]|uniref:Uncharacterized protein n=1 Tax=Acorus calamus TaxID=4465 RepID=A0AAV9FA40_ACOCL|nr:hypothetical protein QJS10_CPA03g01911 [Acorus calamus]